MIKKIIITYLAIFSLNMVSDQSIDVSRNADTNIKITAINLSESRFISSNNTNLRMRVGTFGTLFRMESDGIGNLVSINNKIYGTINGIFQEIDIPALDLANYERGFFLQIRRLQKMEK